MFEPENDEQLSRLVTYLLDDGALAEKMGAGGLAYVKDRFSAAIMREQMESGLLRVCNNGDSSQVSQGD
jgi:glycosyltransferase involved in cell wall biosynthesis